MTSLKIFIVISFLFFFQSILYPQNENLILENLSAENGVPLNLTYCMIQDSKGFLWFGTMYGMVRYDGFNYKIFKNNPEDHTSISFNDIISLHEDRKGNLWIGTGFGLTYFDRQQQNFKHF